MTLGHHDTLRQIDLPAGTHQLTCAGALDIAALAHGGLDAQAAGVGHRDLHLGGGTDGSQNAHFHGALGPNDLDLLGAGELAGLGEILLGGQLVAGAVEDVQMLLRQVEMTGGNFNDDVHVRCLL